VFWRVYLCDIGSCRKGWTTKYSNALLQCAERQFGVLVCPIAVGPASAFRQARMSLLIFTLVPADGRVSGRARRERQRCQDGYVVPAVATHSKVADVPQPLTVKSLSDAWARAPRRARSYPKLHALRRRRRRRESRPVPAAFPTARLF
jgi:hypothetical protein